MTPPRHPPLALLALVALLGCAPQRTFLHVDVRTDGTMRATRLRVVVTSASRGKSLPIDVSANLADRASYDFNLEFDAQVEEQVVVDVAAYRNSQLLASGFATAMVAPGEVAQVTIDLGGVPPPVDMASACAKDSCPAGQVCCPTRLPCSGTCVSDCRLRTVPCDGRCDAETGVCVESWDLSTGRTEDLRPPKDYSFPSPDFARPDLRQADLARPDLRPLDQSIPGDLAAPDLQPCEDCGAGACVNLAADPMNCGACKLSCVAPQTLCVAGKCAETCPTGLSACAARCVDLRTDPRNCGKCGLVCAAGVCAAGVCSNTG